MKNLGFAGEIRWYDDPGRRRPGFVGFGWDFHRMLGGFGSRFEVWASLEMSGVIELMLDAD